jgi:F-type H+-transporting ATPase subunit b
LNALVTTLIVAQEVQDEANEPEDLYPHANELIVGAIAFAILFFFTWKWVLPRIGRLLEERRQRIQGNLEEAEKARRDAEQLLAQREQQLRDAGAEASKIMDDARKTAEKMREDLLAKAEGEARQVVARAQEEIGAERDRAFQDLRRQVGELSVELAERVMGDNLDKERQLELVDGYIDELAGTGDGNGRKGGGGS